MPRFIFVLVAAGKWLLGSIIIVAGLWTLLMFCEDGREPSAWIKTVEHWWLIGSVVAAVLFGYPLVRLFEWQQRRVEAIEAVANSFFGLGGSRNPTPHNK